MLIHGYLVDPLNIATFIAGFLIHPLVGYLFVNYATDINPKWGALGGIIPNLDLVFYVWPHTFPFVHRGLVHTPFFLGMLVALLGWKYPRAMTGIAIGYLLELGLDVFESPIGIMWLYPWSTTHYALPIPDMQVWIPASTIILGLAVYLHTHTRVVRGHHTTRAQQH